MADPGRGGQAGLTERRFLAPVPATFAPALPFALRGVDALPGTTVQLHLRGESGGDWSIRREGRGWKLYAGVPSAPDGRVGLDQFVAWRLFAKGITPGEAEREVTFEGDRRLGEPVLHTLATIA